MGALLVQVRKLFVSLDKSRRGRLDDEAIGKLLEMLGEPAPVVADKVVATRVEINGGDEDEDRVRPKPTLILSGHGFKSLIVRVSLVCQVELDQFWEWWRDNATDEDAGPTAALICGAMGKREAATEALGGALLATRLKIGRPEPLSR